jgi:uncharacterized protein YuzE
MKQPQMNYDKEQDILYIVIREGEEHHFGEVADGISVEFDENNQPIGLEIFNASKVLLPVFKREPSEIATP